MNFFQKLIKSVQSAVSAFTSAYREEGPEIDESIRQDSELENFKNENRDIINRANAQMKQLEDLDLTDFSKAYENALISGGAFNIDDLDDKQAVMREILRAENFLNDETANIDVASAEKKYQIGSETQQQMIDAGMDIYRTRMHEDNVVKDFWEAVDRIREEDDIGARLTAIQYSKDQAYGYAFNVWVQSGFNQAVLKDALIDFLNEQDRIHTKSFQPEKGVATFEGNDW